MQLRLFESFFWKLIVRAHPLKLKYAFVELTATKKLNTTLQLGHVVEGVAVRCTKAVCPIS